MGPTCQDSPSLFLFSFSSRSAEGSGHRSSQPAPQEGARGHTAGGKRGHAVAPPKETVPPEERGTGGEREGDPVGTGRANPRRHASGWPRRPCIEASLTGGTGGEGRAARGARGAVGKAGSTPSCLRWPCESCAVMSVMSRALPEGGKVPPHWFRAWAGGKRPFAYPELGPNNGYQREDLNVHPNLGALVGYRAHVGALLELL